MADIKKGGVVASAKKSVVASNASPLAVVIKRDDIQKKFQDMLGKKAAGFFSSLLSVVNSNILLQKASPMSVLAAAAKAAALDLPIDISLGKAYIVPYKNDAQFQIGYKGIIELAQRTGQMKSIIMTPVYEGEIREWNRFTEEYTPGEKLSDVVVGYFARFETINGFAKAAYWTKEEVTKHAQRFSKAFGNGPWKTDFDAMACKTVLLSIMKTYAPMSIEMQKAVVADGTSFTKEGEEVPPTFDAESVPVEPMEPAEYEEVQNAETEQAEILAAMNK